MVEIENEQTCQYVEYHTSSCPGYNSPVLYCFWLDMRTLREKAQWEIQLRFTRDAPIPIHSRGELGRVVPLHDDNAIRLDIRETIGESSFSVRVAAEISRKHGALMWDLLDGTAAASQSGPSYRGVGDVLCWIFAGVERKGTTDMKTSVKNLIYCSLTRKTLIPGMHPQPSIHR